MKKHNRRVLIVLVAVLSFALCVPATALACEPEMCYYKAPCTHYPQGYCGYVPCPPCACHVDYCCVCVPFASLPVVMGSLLVPSLIGCPKEEEPIVEPEPEDPPVDPQPEDPPVDPQPEDPQPVDPQPVDPVEPVGPQGELTDEPTPILTIAPAPAVEEEPDTTLIQTGHSNTLTILSIVAGIALIAFAIYENRKRATTTTR